MSERDETQEGSEQPIDLFSYIGQSEFQAVNDPLLVEQLESETPVELSDDGAAENVDQVASTGATEQAVTTPANEPTNDEAIRLQQRIQELENGISQRDTALALVANQARKREEDLFNRSLELMTPEEQDQAKETRRIEQLEAENALLRTGQERRRQAEEQTQAQLDKTDVVHKVIAKLGLPADDPFVMSALMESESPPVLFAVANRMAKIFRENELRAQQQVVQQVTQSNVLAAGGETAPTTPPKRVAQRRGELVDMMRERAYTSEQIR